MSLLDDLRNKAQSVGNSLLTALRAEAAKVVTPTPKAPAPIQTKAPIQSVAPKPVTKPAQIATPLPKKATPSVLSLTPQNNTLLDQLRSQSQTPLGLAKPVAAPVVTPQLQKNTAQAGLNIQGGSPASDILPNAIKSFAPAIPAVVKDIQEKGIIGGLKQYATVTSPAMEAEKRANNNAYINEPGISDFEKKRRMIETNPGFQTAMGSVGGGMELTGLGKDAGVLSKTAQEIHPKVLAAIPANDPLQRLFTVQGHGDIQSLLNRSAKLPTPEDVYANIKSHYTDELTGLLGQKFYKQTNMDKAPQVFLDIDNFGKFNEDYSASTGHKVLTTFGQLIEKHFPGSGVRAGGEEFVIDPTGISHAEMTTRLQALREDLLNQSFVGEGGPKNGQMVKNINFTSAFGKDEVTASSAMKDQKHAQKGVDNINQTIYDTINKQPYAEIPSKTVSNQPNPAGSVGSQPTNEGGTSPAVSGLPQGKPGVGAEVRPVETAVGGTVDQYIKEQVARQESERSAGVVKGVQPKVQSVIANIKKSVIDSASPYEDALTAAEKEGKFSVLPKNDVRLQTSRVLRAPSLGSQFAEDNGLIDVIQQVPNADYLNQYLIAKHAEDIARAGFATGRDAAKDAQLVKELAPTYETFAQQITDYSHKLLDYAVESGLVSKELADYLKQLYPNYVPMNRVFSELEKSTIPQTTKALASLSKQTVVQTLQGSERAIENPLESLLLKTQDAFIQGEKNKAAQMLTSYHTFPGNPLNITPLRVAENVQKRILLFTHAKELKPVENALERLIKTRNKWTGVLVRELKKLNIKGLKEALRPGEQKTLEQLKSSITIKHTPAEAEHVRFGKNDRLLQREQGAPKKVEVKDARFATPTNKEVKAFIAQLISDPNVDLQAIKKKIATRENKLSPLLDEIQKLKTQYDDIHGYRRTLLDEAHLLADAKSKGLETISVFRNGIKEIYSVPPEIAAAAKSLDKQQTGLLGKIVSLPTRIARLGITGTNPAFALANLVKDQSMAFVVSKHTLSTSALTNPINFVASLFSALGHGKLYKEMVREAAGGTSYDISRGAIKQSVARVRAGRSVATRVAYSATHPEEILRWVEDQVGRTEELTRIQQYRGTKQALLKQGVSESDARLLAAKAARENTTDFMRGGDAKKVINSMYLFMNARIQGSRTIGRTLFSSNKKEAAIAWAKFATVVGLPVATITAWNLSDPKRKAAYEDIPEYERQNSMIVLPPNPVFDEKTKTWNALKIPLSPDLTGGATLVRRSIELSQKVDEQSFGDFATSMFNAGFGAISPVTIGRDNKLVDKSQVLSTIVPQFAKPAVEYGTNTNLFTGYPIAGNTNVLPADQYNANTSGAMRLLGKATNQSPAKLEQFGKSTFGSDIAGNVLNAADTGLAAVGAIPKDQISNKNNLQSISARFSGARGGAQEQSLATQAEQAKLEEGSAKKQLKEEATKKLDEIRSKGLDQGNKDLEQIYNTNKPLYDEILAVDATNQKGLSPSERIMSGLGVSDGARARFIWDHVQTLHTKDEKNSYLEDLYNKKILTADVNRQILQLAGQ